MRNVKWFDGLLIASVCALAGCGVVVSSGGQSSAESTQASEATLPKPPRPRPDPPKLLLSDPISDAAASRFLAQATFGVTRADIARVKSLGYAGWLDEQMDVSSAPMTLVRPYIEGLLANGVVVNQPHRRNAWLWYAAKNKDQLRMRMAFALSEIFVISDNSSGQGQILRVADYQDTLARNAFGSYRELIEDVTLHPGMGVYLSHAGNQKASADGLVVPDENYAREVMQLFSIGLKKRSLDFSPVLVNGKEVPTYDSAVVSAMARVFTGWTYAGLTDKDFEKGKKDSTGYAPMECHPAFHDDQLKTIFNGIKINFGDDCVATLDAALDALSNHANTAPFISRQLIQRFVTSNPSPAYIKRVAQVWLDNDGDLGEVIRAILLDSEARTPPVASDTTYGKPREPLLRIANMWRSYEARYLPPADGTLRFNVANMGDLTAVISQDSQRAPSVFNFFEPDYRTPMVDGSQGPYAPELQIINESTFTTAHNQTDFLLWNYADVVAPTDNTNAPVVDIANLVALADAGNHAGMVQDVNLLLFAGSLPAARVTIMKNMLDDLKVQNRTSSELARSLLLLAFHSPDYAVLR